mgnify:CR=1 FL=1
MLASAIVVCLAAAVVVVAVLGMSMVVEFFQLAGTLRELERADLDEAIVDAAVVFVLTLPGGDVGVFS